jgi:hypothetical protein
MDFVLHPARVVHWVTAHVAVGHTLRVGGARHVNNVNQNVGVNQIV